MNIVIVAAGLATRLKPLTNYIPKLLVNIGKETGMTALVNYWRQYSTSFTIIIHSQYKDLVQAYWDLYYKHTELELTIVTCDEAKGTRRTIVEHTPTFLDDEDVLFTWCDVIPGEAIPKMVFTRLHARTDLVFLHGQNSRYIFGCGDPSSINSAEDWCIRRPRVEQNGKGDVIGIYFLQRFNREALNQVESDDVADAIHLHGQVLHYHKLESVIDFGDKEKLERLLSATDGAREFNKLTRHDNGFIFKEARDKQGEALIKNEIGWYQHLHKVASFDVVPQVYLPPNNDPKGFFIEEIAGCSVFKIFDKLTSQEQFKTVEKILATLTALHSHKFWETEDRVVIDIEREARTKLYDRLAEIENVINAFGTPRIVNGVSVPNVDEAIHFLYTNLVKHYTADSVLSSSTPIGRMLEYSLIHGDAQFSNIMYNNGDVKLIDPRGYFGTSKFYGLPEYDEAKVLYSLSGYDGFNTSTRFHLSYLDNGRVGFEIPRPEITFNPRELFNKPVQYAWLAVIWIGLAQYIKNNPVKSYAALCHGLYLTAKLEATGGTIE